MQGRGFSFEVIMKCWFKRALGSDWESGLIVSYIGALGTTAAVVVKVDKRGELLSLPLVQASCGDLKPEDGHAHYKDPRYPDEPKATAYPFGTPMPPGGVAGTVAGSPIAAAVATKAPKEAGGK